MEIVGKTLLIVGVLLAVGAQIHLFIRLAKRHFINAVLALVIPGYLLHYAIFKDPSKRPILLYWLAGLLLFILAIAVLS